ncbi:hypothetical protein HNP84_001814 [Thermocatellispora tengchongensis]|uniref:Uncharacterized protein n=1 Tax=Thermocatellispora tengchongensis TaxID=1073253 RepID=A0A840P2I2_9ACTN|nr:hypothetical protein [Thermocatellispora tengchongensis]MBB5132101.1 hypothetical protein [Thermocatellispora tengchongensis]
MKRIVAGLAVAAGAALVAPVPVHAAAKVDPVKALREQFEGGKGVEVASLTKMAIPGGPSTTVRESGVIEFGGSAPVASDLTSERSYNSAYLGKLNKDQRERAEAERGPVRTISVNSASYVSRAPYPDELPVGKSWVRYEEVPGRSGLVDVLEPATLKALVSAASSNRDGVIKGTITTAKLAAASPSARRQFGRGGSAKIAYTVWLDASGLVERVVAAASPSRYDVTYEARFRSWGHSVSIFAPSQNDVVRRSAFDNGGLDQMTLNVEGVN